MYSRIFGLFNDERVHVLTALVTDTAISHLCPNEALLVTNAINKRKREFAMGRQLARQGLQRYFGIKDYELTATEHQVPRWPKGISGSLSHTNERAWIALVDSSIASVGIDGENRSGLDKKLWTLVLCETELNYINSLEISLQTRRALTIFSAKESLYKAQFPIT